MSRRFPPPSSSASSRGCAREWALATRAFPAACTCAVCRCSLLPSRRIVSAAILGRGSSLDGLLVGVDGGLLSCAGLRDGGLLSCLGDGGLGLGGLGLGLASRSLVLTAATLLVLGALFARAAAAEDRFLAARFDARFESYRAATPRFWPRRWPHRWRLGTPDTVSVRPDVLWKAFVDAGAFFLLFVLVLAARQWSDLRLLPAPLLLP